MNKSDEAPDSEDIDEAPSSDAGKDDGDGGEPSSASAADDEAEAAERTRARPSAARKRKKKKKKRGPQPDPFVSAEAASSSVDSSSSAPKSASGGGFGNAFLFGLLGLLVGGLAGWAARDMKAQGDDGDDTATAAPAGSGAAAGGPCADWKKQVCEGAGAKSAACTQAQAALDLLTPPACTKALADVPATLAKIKAARADCDNLVSKLCKDLGPDSKECKLVTEKTPSFPPQRCKGMLTNYDKVIAGLKQIQAGGGPGMQGMPPGGMRGPGGMPMRPGMAPPGMARPGMAPPGMAPPGMPPKGMAPKGMPPKGASAPPAGGASKPPTPTK